MCKKNMHCLPKIAQHKQILQWLCLGQYCFSLEHFLDENDNSLINTTNPVATLKAKRTWNKIKRRKGYVKQSNWVIGLMLL